MVVDKKLTQNKYIAYSKVTQTLSLTFVIHFELLMFYLQQPLKLSVVAKQNLTMGSHSSIIRLHANALRRILVVQKCRNQYFSFFIAG